ncbi:MAG: hypothetical protein JWP89_864 [Schlesneria sp.]|nr:hypothetical protein [Schlesneria sp.]
MLKVSQVAIRLNCSASTVYGLIESGRLAHHRCPGVRVSEEQLATYLEQTKQVPLAEPAKPMRPCPPRRLKNVKL